VSDTYRQYIIIYAPGIIGAVLALVSVQMPLLGRKWSLVFSAICQGLAMAMYTQVYTTAGYVGLNALEYIMQTVSPLILCFLVTTYTYFLISTSTPSSMHLRPSCLTRVTVAVSAVCYPAWVVLLVLLHHMPVRSSLKVKVRVFYGWVLVVFGFLLS
jgi:hypothetical protein